MILSKYAVGKDHSFPDGPSSLCPNEERSISFLAGLDWLVKEIWPVIREEQKNPPQKEGSCPIAKILKREIPDYPDDINKMVSESKSRSQSFNFLSKYKTGASNVVADVLSRRYTLLSVLEARVFGFSCLKELYKEDPDFAPILLRCANGSSGHYSMQEGFLFKQNKLCIPKSPIRELLVKEVHGGAIAGHFGINKRVDILQEHFDWPKLAGDVHAVISRCSTCQRANFTKGCTHHCLYLISLGKL